MLRFESEPACPSKLLIARCYSTIRARIRPNGFERILAHRIGCQRATASLSSRVASKQLCNYSEDGSECQHLETKKFRISTTFIRTPVSSLEGERYRQCTMCREVFPAARASAKVIARLRKFPIASWPFATTPCLAQYRVSVPNGNREWLLSGRVDYEFSDKDKIFGRVKFDRGSQPTYTDPIDPVFNIQSNQPQNEGQLNYTHVFSPRVVNNFVGSVLYYSALFQSPNLSSALSAFPFILSTNDTSLTPLGSGSGSDPFFPRAAM